MLKKVLIPLSIAAALGAGVFTYSSFQQNESEKTATAAVQTHKDLPVYETNGSYEVFSNVDDMEKKADLVVVASPKKAFDQRKHITTYFEGPNANEKYPENCFTITDMKVKKVLSSKTEAKKKDVDITVLEPVGIYKDNDGVNKKLRFEGYEEMSNSKDYILYLEENDKGNYNIVNIVDGKFEVKDTAKKADKDSYLSEHAELHSNLEKATKTKFKKELTEYTK